MPSIATARLEQHMPTNKNLRRPDFISRKRSITTLNPQKLVRSDFVDFSGHIQPVIYPQRLPRSVVNFHFINSKGIPFPPNTRGFLYYHSPPGAPFAGQIRFRLVEDGDPSKFAQSSDLMGPLGVPWHIHVTWLGSKSTYKSICTQLLSENLATWSILNKYKNENPPRARTPVVHSVGQPFSMSFSSDQHLRVSKKQNMGVVTLRNLFTDYRDSNSHLLPYRGNIHLSVPRLYIHTHALCWVSYL